MATPHQSQHQCTLQTEATLGTSTNNATPISLATQSLSAATAGSNQQEQVVAARSASGSVLLLDAHSFQPKQLLSLPPPLPPVAVANAANTLQQPILGVVLSPSGTHIAAYAADRLLLAQCASKHDCTLGQLDNAARIPAGIRSVHWSPCGRVLAVCSKTQPEVLLYVLVPPALWQKPKQRQRQHQQQHSDKLTFACTLRGPDRLTRGPTAATWVHAPHEVVCPGSTVGLLVAWPLQLLLFTWQVPASGCMNWCSHSTHEILTAWPGTPKALLTLQQQQQPAAAAVGWGSGAAAAAAGQVVRVVAAVDADTQWRDGGGSAVQQSAPAHTTESAAAAAVGNGATLKGVIMPLAAGGGVDNNSSSSMAGEGGGGVLGSLMNISSSGQQGPSTSTSLLVQELAATNVADSAAGTGITISSSSSTPQPQQASSSYLCLLTLNLSWLNSNSPSGPSSGSNNTAAAAQPSGAIASSSLQPIHNSDRQQGGTEHSAFVTVLQLPEQPLARYLAATAAGDGSSQLVVVGSSTGAPRVTLCAVSDTSGLEALQTVVLPLPRAVMGAVAAAVDEGSGSGSGNSSSQKQARLQGLLLVGAVGATSAADSSACDILALVACSDKPAGAAAAVPGFFGVFGGSGSSSRSAATTELHLLRVGVGKPHQPASSSPVQQQGQQQQEQEQPHEGRSGSEDAVVAALRALQTSLETRLDAMQATLSSMEARLAALEQGQNNKT